MGLYLLNISVDPSDPNPQHIPEDLSFNDQESIVEIIVEYVLGYEDAIKEYDDHDKEDHNAKKNVRIDVLVHQTTIIEDIQRQFLEKKPVFLHFEALLTNGFTETHTPPPKV